MNRWMLRLSIALAGIVLTSVPVSAATLEYTFSVPYKVAADAGLGSASAGAGSGAVRPMSVSCAVGPAALSYSTATGGAAGATGSGTTQNVRSSPATVVVTVDAETRGEKTGAPASKLGAGGALQPTQANGYYTCWATFASGQTPVNFLPTTALPKVPLK